MPREGQTGTLPDGTKVIFQNGQVVPKHGGVGDTLRSFGAGAIQGAANIPGMVGDAMDWGYKKISQQEHDHLAQMQARGDPAADEFASDLARREGNLAKSRVMHPMQTQDYLNAAPKSVQAAAAYQPQTTAGKYGKTVGAFAPGLVTGPVGEGGNIVNVAKSGLGRAATTLSGAAIANMLVPGVASESAGQLAKRASGGKEGTKAEALARLIGGGVGGAAGAIGSGAPKEARMIADSLDGVSDHAVRSAANLGRTSQRVGVPLTMAEAVQHTAPHATINQTAKIVEQSPQGAGLREAYAQRVPGINGPGQFQTAGNRVLDQISPADRPDMVSTRAQAAADSALRGVEGERTAAASPHYQAAAQQQVNPADVQSIVDDMRAQAGGDQTGLIGPRLAEMADRFAPNGQPITDIGQLDTLRGHYRDLSDLPPGTEGALDRRQSGAISPYLQRLSNENRTGLLDQSPEFVQGNQTHQDMSRDVVDPALAGPLGTIAGRQANSRPTIATQGSALYPSASPEGQPAVTTEALGRMGDQGAPLTRQFLAQKLAEQLQGNVGGENQWGGAKFAADVAGNQNQRAALEAGVGQVAPGAQQPLADMLDTFGATGTRLRPGSNTKQDLATDADMISAGKASRLGALGAAPWKVVEEGLSALNLHAGEQRRQRIADLLQSDPATWEAQIEEMRRQSRSSLPINMTRAGVAGAVNAQGAQ